MAVGDSALLSHFSYLGIGRETTVGTYSTAPAGLDFLSATLKTQKDSKILEQIERYRTYTARLSLSKNVGGDVDFYFRPNETACLFILQNAFGGTVTSATVTGETTGGGGLDHTFVTGNFDNSYSSLCINMRKGPSSGGKVFQYSGVRVNDLTVRAEIDEPVMMSMNLIGMDSTQNSNDIESVMTATGNPVLSFADARFSLENNFSSLTSSSFWHVQSVEFKISNNLKNGTEARRIGSDILSVLPAGVQTYELTCQMRFNTTTAYDAMVAGTNEYALELAFLGTTLSGSVARRALKFQFQKVMVKDAGDPEISGPDGVLTSQVTFDVLRDESATGYAVRAIVTNNSAFTAN